MFIVISYDIVNDRRRSRVARILEDYGERVQFSVFEMEVTEKQLMALRKELKKEIDLQEDSVRFYRLCVECHSKARVLGKGQLTEDADVFII